VRRKGGRGASAMLQPFGRKESGLGLHFREWGTRVHERSDVEGAEEWGRETQGNWSKYLQRLENVLV